MKPDVYMKKESDENFVKAFNTNKGWEIEISYKGKTLKYGASSCNRSFFNKKQAFELVDDIFTQGIAPNYEKEHKRQYGY